MGPNGENPAPLFRFPRGPQFAGHAGLANWSNLAWSPDGRWIFFIGEGDVLKRISADGNQIVEIGKLPYRGGPFSIAPFNK